MARPAPDPEYALRGCDGPVTCLLFISESGSAGSELKRHQKTLVCGTQNGSIYVWDLNTRRVRRRIESHTNSVLGLYDLSRTVDDGVERRVLSHGRDGLLYLWRVDNSDWSKIGNFSCCSLNFCRADVVMVPGQGHVIAVTGDEQSGVNLINAESGDIVNTLAPGESNLKPGMCMALKLISNPDDGALWLLAGYEDGRIALWDCHSRALLSNNTLHAEPVMCFDYSQSLNKGVSGSVDETISVWTLDNTTHAICPRQQVRITNPGLNCVLFREDGKFFLTGGWDHKIRLFSSKHHKAVALLGYHRDSIQCAAFSSDFTLAVGSKDGMISLWNIYK